MTGAELKAWRQRLGWTQDEAGEELGVTKRSISNYETSEVPKSIALAARFIEIERGSGVRTGYDEARGYQVMIQGREHDITDLSRDQAIVALKELLDHFESVDELSRDMSKRLEDFRYGRRARSS